MTVYACPKPAPGRRKPGRIVRVNKSDGKEVEIRRSPKAWEERREEVGEAAGYRCQHRPCGRPAPLHDEEIDCGEDVLPVIVPAGHTAHKDARKMGGGSRNDKSENLGWLCRYCHHLETIGKLEIVW